MDFNQNFRTLVENLVTNIPRGRVMTYGQIAVLCGRPNAARIVGGIDHFGNPEIPWHRVVNKHGGLASGYPGGRVSHKNNLKTEGVPISGDRVLNIDKVLWRPEL